MSIATRMMKPLLALAVLATSLAAAPAMADWHVGRIRSLGFAYDGLTVVLAITGWNRTNCTCYPGWSSNMCLDASRDTHKSEFAWLMKARAMDHSINVNIDESTCTVQAMYEIDQ